MKADPSTQRARSVVLLVVLTIALPSILLTVISAAAVGNEEVAARRRLERAYQPVTWDLAKKFGDDVDALVAAAGDPLEQLVHFAPPGCEDPEIYEDAMRAMEEHFRVEARGDNVRVHVRQPRINLERIRRLGAYAKREALQGVYQGDNKALTSFVETYPEATNYFVIAPDGQVLVPGSANDEDPTEQMPGALLEAGKKDGACEDEEKTCIVKYARASAAGEYEEDCDAYAKTPAAAMGLVLNNEFQSKSRDNKHFVDSANNLARVLSNPLKPVPPQLSELLARRAARQLAHIPGVEAERARYLFMTIAERPALLRYMSKLSHPHNSDTQITAYGIEDWRRLIVLRNVDGFTVGFELVPTQFEATINNVLAESPAREGVMARIEAIQLPPFMKKKMSKEEMEAYDEKTATWALLRRSDVAWKIVLQMTDEGALLGLMQSRSTLYSWAIVLIAVALLGGIGYTVRSVIREAQLARLKTDFVSSVSHDLRTPLTSIRMFTETLLLNRASSEQEAREFLRVIADETERLSRLTERILDFSRMEAGRKAYHFSPLDIRDLIQRSLAACRPMIEEAGFLVTVEVDEDLPPISADHDAMIEVLINLVSNAIKYSPEEKKIGIVARRERDFVAISVSDRGIGIPKSEHKKIFEKFYRVECRRTCEVGGSGIGLSLVDHIVSAHQGAVDVASKPGEGSTFTVRVAVAGV